MDFFTVALFGHREIDDLRRLEKRLIPVIENLIKAKPFVSFWIGRQGEFDEFAASVIKGVRRKKRGGEQRIGTCASLYGSKSFGL